MERSPMTTWLEGKDGRVAVLTFAKNRARCRLIQNPTPVDLTRIEPPTHLVTAVGGTAEEAMANALNALMAQQGEEGGST